MAARKKYLDAQKKVQNTLGTAAENLLGFKKDEILKGLDNGLAKAVNGAGGLSDVIEKTIDRQTLAEEKAKNQELAQIRVLIKE